MSNDATEKKVTSNDDDDMVLADAELDRVWCELCKADDAVEQAGDQLDELGYIFDDELRDPLYAVEQRIHEAGESHAACQVILRKRWLREQTPVQRVAWLTTQPVLADYGYDEETGEEREAAS